MVIAARKSLRLRSPEGTKLSRKACSTIGKRGFQVTTDRHFCGRVDFHKRWLKVKAAANYAQQAMRPGSVNGKFPPQIIHPSKMTFGGKHVLIIVSLRPSRFTHFVPFLMDDDLHCIEACLFGSVRGRGFYTF